MTSQQKTHKDGNITYHSTLIKIQKENISRHFLQIQISCSLLCRYSVLCLNFYEFYINRATTKPTQHINSRQPEQIRILQQNIFKQMTPQTTVHRAMNQKMKFILNNPLITQNTYELLLRDMLTVMVFKIIMVILWQTSLCSEFKVFSCACSCKKRSLLVK